ncbi:hypothetical protein ACFM35_00015 [Microbacterium sp. P01]|uniref:hypothetical protein n=1 Tax=Microbacterium sp. P01 TaxID=3366261 RepID=UPI0036735503
MTPDATKDTTTPLMAPPAGDADWECGQASALLGMQQRSEWELANGVIDQGAFDSREAALIDAWTYLPIGTSEVTSAVRATIAAASEGIGQGNPMFAESIAQLNAACDATGSVVIVGALPAMGG